MMMNNTLAQLRELKLVGMASAVEEQLCSTASTALSFEERLALVVDREVHQRADKRHAALLKRARLKYPQACIEDVDGRAGRGFERSALMSLALSRWVEDGAAILVTGPTGSGKSWLACALAQYACRRGQSALYLRVPRLAEELRILHGNGGFTRWLAAVARTDVLLLDDWALAAMDGPTRADLMEVIDDRAGTRATIIASQLPVEHWHAWIGREHRRRDPRPAAVAQPPIGVEGQVAAGAKARGCHGRHRRRQRHRRRGALSTASPVDLWTGPLARASRLNAQGRSPVDGRMDTPAGCPRAHPQAVGCPQAPQGPTTGDGKAQAIPRALLRHRRAVNSHQGGHQPASSPVFLQSQPRNPAPSLRSVTFPKSPVTFAEMRSAVVVPDNVLFEGGAGETIRRKLMHECDVHTLLRLPTGLFYAQGVKANVIFFDKKPASETPWTRKLWIYDLRTNKHFTLKTNPLRRADLDEFVALYHPANRHQRQATWSAEKPNGRWRVYQFDELAARDKASLDIFWLRDESLADSDNLPPPEVIAQEIVEDLEAALEQFRLIAADLGERA